MRKLYSILVWALLIAVAGCSDDDDKTVANSLKVISSDVKFTSAGGSGTIEVSSTSPVEVSSNAEWCQTALAGNVITVTVEKNTGLSSRTALVIIKSGNEKAELPVTQPGRIFDTDLADYSFSEEGGPVTFKLESPKEIRVTGMDESWLAYQWKDGKITFTASPLTEGGSYRENHLTIETSGHVVNFTFSQVNLLGEYRMLFTYRGQRVEASCKVERTDVADVYTFTPMEALFDDPFKVRYRPGEVVITFGQFLEVDAQG